MTVSRDFKAVKDNIVHMFSTYLYWRGIFPKDHFKLISTEIKEHIAPGVCEGIIRRVIIEVLVDGIVLEEFNAYFGYYDFEDNRFESRKKSNPLTFENMRLFSEHCAKLPQRYVLRVRVLYYENSKVKGFQLVEFDDVCVLRPALYVNLERFYQKTYHVLPSITSHHSALDPGPYTGLTFKEDSLIFKPETGIVGCEVDIGGNNLH